MITSFFSSLILFELFCFFIGGAFFGFLLSIIIISPPSILSSYLLIIDFSNLLLIFSSVLFILMLFPSNFFLKIKFLDFILTYLICFSWLIFILLIISLFNKSGWFSLEVLLRYETKLVLLGLFVLLLFLALYKFLFLFLFQCFLVD